MSRNRVFAIIIAVLATIFIIAIGVNSSSSSDASNDDQGATIDRNGSVETAISVQHADSAHDVILSSHKVWVKDSIYTTIIHRDTVPALDSLTTEAENGSGDTQSVRVKKDYQLFITVK